MFTLDETTACWPSSSDHNDLRSRCVAFLWTTIVLRLAKDSAFIAILGHQLCKWVRLVGCCSCLGCVIVNVSHTC